MAGEIKNVYTKKDYILGMLYSPCEVDLAMGRHDVFADQFLDNQRTNLLGQMEDYGWLEAVSQPS